MLCKAPLQWRQFQTLPRSLRQVDAAELLCFDAQSLAIRINSGADNMLNRIDKVYPELVIRDDAGKIQGVRYDELAPMLFNEVQAAMVASLEQQLSGSQAAPVKLQSKDQLVAER
jgi:hypothetical protein